MTTMLDHQPVDKMMSYSDILDQHGASGMSGIEDRFLGWVNENKPRCVASIIRDVRARTQGQVSLWRDMRGAPYKFWNEPHTREGEFEAALDEEITIWRGGGGEFNPDHRNGRSWTSFTARKDRSATFSVYNGTHASRGFMLRRRTGPWWVVELKIKLRDVLYYFDGGGDAEVIVSRKWLSKARVVATHDNPSFFDGVLPK